MVTTEDLRRFATAFPEVTEFTHQVHRQPGFKVRGMSFAGLEKGAHTAVFSVTEEEGAAAVAAEPISTRRSAGSTAPGSASAPTSPPCRRRVYASSSPTPGATAPRNAWSRGTTPDER